VIARSRIHIDQLAAKIGRHVGFVRGLLAELETAGLAEQDDDGNWWRLSDEGERRFGAALREGVRQL
jgi:DNA-binding IclR family transcriptional regulator